MRARARARALRLLVGSPHAADAAPLSRAQVLATCHALRKPCGVEAVAIYGGEPREEQAEAMERAVPLLVATTGRLVDMVLTKDVQLGRVRVRRRVGTHTALPLTRALFMGR